MAGVVSQRYLLASALATALAAMAIGVPTELLPNPWFTRMTPVREIDLILWPATSLAIGLLLGTYALPGLRAAGCLSRGSGSGLLGVFAVGCPVCNKLVVLALGFSGALTYFEPIQPLLGVGAVALSLAALRTRLRASPGCLVPAPHGEPAEVP